MRRRDFVKTGSLVFTGLATGNLGISFIPDAGAATAGQGEDGLRNRLLFRKPPRTIREVVPGLNFLSIPS